MSDALRAATEWLRASGSRSPRRDAELLLANARGVDRTELFRAPERVLTPVEERRFDGYLVRRQAREPVAYIRGHRAFRSIELEVTPAVLIPRPETETLVDVALEVLAALPGPGAAASGSYEPLALDVGTGSGCIALALAAENPYVRLVATDVSEAAVEVARRNAARLGLGGRVDIRHGDLLDDLPSRERFDLIVSNPPYIPEAEYRALEANVRDYEPRLALHGGDDGLDVYRRLIPGSAGRLRPGGVLAVEVGAGQAAAVRALCAAAGAFRPAQERADLAGTPRVVFARLSTRHAGG
ncbi:MAG: peptide chain release factor N(5)-glutamine methyltransferase [Actinobacteria bacterium]|nr:peptide chain release factor N(5)-glutamine methyltransferase [Actinomycetota bacterium]